MSRGRAATATAVLVPLLAACGTAHPRARQAHVAAVAQLPDLIERPPAQVIGGVVRWGGRNHYSVGFQTSVVNRGHGIMLIEGHRRRGQSVMVADQLIDRVEAPPLVVKGVGWLSYYPHGHDHWHLLPFALYQLRSADGRRVLVRGRKNGYCIASNGRAAARPARIPPHACGMFQPKALFVGEGLGPGGADTYPAYLDGQSLPLDGIPAGRYYLVIWVNRERRLRESNYRNDAGSTLVRISYGDGLAHVKALASCFRLPPCR
jgi:Lysyl oxidase